MTSPFEINRKVKQKLLDKKEILRWPFVYLTRKLIFFQSLCQKQVKKKAGNLELFEEEILRVVL